MNKQWIEEKVREFESLTDYGYGNEASSWLRTALTQAEARGREMERERIARVSLETHGLIPPEATRKVIREEGVFYDEGTAKQWGECCEECCDVHFEKTYPSHTAYLACRNLNCSCHTTSDTV